MIVLGIQEGTCTLIGNCIGANNVPLAKRFYSLIAKIVTVVVIFIFLITFFCRKQLVAVFTSDEDVTEMVTPLFILIAIMKIGDSF